MLDIKKKATSKGSIGIAIHKVIRQEIFAGIEPTIEPNSVNRV